MFTKEMMKRVHEIAKGFEGDYSARLALAFREVLKDEDLEGTEKQIAWAKDLKAKMLSKLTFFVEHSIEEYIPVLSLLIEDLANIKSAVFFIDNRNCLELREDIVDYFIEKFDYESKEEEIYERANKN